MINIFASFDVICIGGGPAGLAAAISAKENGASKVLILERNSELGGILNQCIHNGFGLHYFKTELTGPEYAELFIDKAISAGIEIMCGTTALEIESANKTHFIHAVNKTNGYMRLKCKAVVLAMGCRERTRGALSIPGSRPSGILTAGAAQLYMNIEGYKIGNSAVILGSGDIGLIMARRLTLEGAKVLGVYELMPYSNGLNRNIVQCLEDYNIPLYLSHTVVNIKGKNRLEEITVAQVDKNLKPISGTEKNIQCDTLLLSVGLIPENELSRQAGIALDARTKGPLLNQKMETSKPGIFACGNVAHVHDLVDFVSNESYNAGQAAANYCVKNDNNANIKPDNIELINGYGISYTVPQFIEKPIINSLNKLDIFMRVNSIFNNALINIKCNNNIIASFKREHLAPGEMIKITLPQAILAKINSSKIIIEINNN